MKCQEILKEALSWQVLYLNMKPLIALVLLFSSSAGEVFALSQDTIYYDVVWKETTADKASYFRIRSKLSAGWQVTDYFLFGKPQMTGGYADDSFHIRQGEFVWYDSSGVVIHRCLLKNNKQNGLEFYYYKSGQVQMSGRNEDDEAEGDWIGYYPSGKISGKAKFKKGKQVSGVFYKEDGSRNKAVTEFSRESEFPGGGPNWLRFLNKTFRYPDTAVDREIEGTVVIGFMVSKEGKVYDLRVVHSVDKYLDEEALRVMRQTPDWTPAIFGGIISDSYKLQPIVFKLRSD